MTSEMVTAVYYGLFQIRKLLDDKYLVRYRHWCFKLWYFYGCEELQNSKKVFYDKQTRNYRISCLKMAVPQSY